MIPALPALQVCAGQYVCYSYFLVETPDDQIFELFGDAAQGDVWMLYVCQD